MGLKSKFKKVAASTRSVARVVNTVSSNPLVMAGATAAFGPAGMATVQSVNQASGVIASGNLNSLMPMAQQMAAGYAQEYAPSAYNDFQQAQSLYSQVQGQYQQVQAGVNPQLRVSGPNDYQGQSYNNPNMVQYSGQAPVGRNSRSGGGFFSNLIKSILGW